MACDLDEALAACAAVAVDVLITDQRLGAGTGTELAARVRAAAPQTRIVLITGYVEDAEVIAAQAAGLVSHVGAWFGDLAVTELQRDREHKERAGQLPRGRPATPVTSHRGE